MFRRKRVLVYGKRRRGRVILAFAILGGLYALTILGGAKGALAGSLLFIPAIFFLRWAMRRPRYNMDSTGRNGLLNKARRPPLTNREHKLYLLRLKQAATRNAMAQEANKQRHARLQSGADPRERLHSSEIQTPLSLVDAEVIRLVKTWHRGPNQPLSDDEMRSIELLYRVGVGGDQDVLPAIEPEDQGIIEDWETINALRDRTWLEKVGDPDASYMVSRGWIPFLKLLDPPDIKLWHNVVNTFHDLYGHQLEAAYWILAQPQCDKATVYGFFTGYIGYGDLRILLKDAAREGRSLIGAAKPLVEVVNRWNTGFYRWHSLSYDEDETPNENLEDGAALNETLASLSAEFGVYLPLISDIEFDPKAPIDDMSRSADSRFEYCDGHPLQLGFPHMWPDAVSKLR